MQDPATQQIPEINPVQIRRAKRSEVAFFAENSARLALDTEGKICDMARAIEFTAGGFAYPEKTSFWIAAYDGKDVGSFCLTVEFNLPRNCFFTWF
jgi:hypothetical protein